MNPAELAREIVETHHAFLRREMPRLDEALADAPESVRGPWLRFRRSMDDHLAKEEGILFPMIESLVSSGEAAGCGVEGPILQMMHEHEQFRALEAEMRAALDDAGDARGALLALLDDLAEHAAKEDERLFPAVLELAGCAPDLRPPAEDGEALGGGGENGASGEDWGEPPEGDGAIVEVVRHTRGTCSVCAADVPARVARYERAVHLEKRCAEHGVTRQLLSRAPDYWVELDRFYFRVNGEVYPQRDFIVRMTEACNLDCPICLAKANTEDTPDLDLTGLEKLLSERRGIKIDLMAAEPTLREDLEDWVRRVKGTGNIAALHTNGLKLANMDYARRIKEAGVDEVFLQFDGFDDDAHEVLRGRRLLKARLKALDNLRELGMATSLIVVIARGLNEAEVARTYRFALRPENRHIREVFFLGLRLLGSARHQLRHEGGDIAEMAMMPDETLELLVQQEPGITRRDVMLFNKLYFSMLSAFRVKKCLYVQHYLVERDGRGGARPFSEIVDLEAIGRVCDRYAERIERHPRIARALFLGELTRAGLNRNTMRILVDLLRLNLLLKLGMNLHKVPERFLLLGFITACDLYNFDSHVALNCGKGELSVDGGFVDSGAVANVRREARFDASDREPGERKRREREARA